MKSIRIDLPPPFNIQDIRVIEHHDCIVAGVGAKMFGKGTTHEKIYHNSFYRQAFDFCGWHIHRVVSISMSSNPRSQNGNLRRKNRARFKAMGLPCAICGKPIHYDEPSDAQHPFSFVIDEIIPVSRWREFGYPSPAAVANDFNNLQPCHRICNAKKGTKIGYKIDTNRNNKPHKSDGEW